MHQDIWSSKKLRLERERTRTPAKHWGSFRSRTFLIWRQFSYGDSKKIIALNCLLKCRQFVSVNGGAFPAPSYFSILCLTMSRVRSGLPSITLLSTLSIRASIKEYLPSSTPETIWINATLDYKYFHLVLCILINTRYIVYIRELALSIHTLYTNYVRL